ncbi:MAG: M48 family metallopeptidase [Candidatus Peribacteraceae bacterium]|nr:M48 family metallopeptidase [Candidatus Peribacteraceae bacterium]
MMPKKVTQKFRKRIERTKNKHSRAVYKDGTIIIRLAKGLNSIEERKHIEWLYRSMTQHLLEERRTKIVIDPFASLLNGAEKCTINVASGKRYTFTLYPGYKTESERTDFGFRIYIGPRTKKQSLHRFLWKTLSEAEKPRIEQLVENINNNTLKVKYNKVRLSFASSQWGSCSPKGVIMLNSALLFVPPSSLKYVIIHELAHRKRCNHSPAFWNLVEIGMPTYKRAKKALQTYRLPTL